MSYDYESSPMADDVEDIIGSGPKSTVYDYQCTLHTVKDDIKISRLQLMERTRDYYNKVGDSVVVNFMMPLGDYINSLYPYRTNLEFTIKKTIMDASGTERKKETKSITTRWKAIFDVTKNPVVGATEVEAIDATSLNTQKLVDVHLELTDRSMEPLRIKIASGIFHNKTMAEIISGVMMGESNNVLIDGKPGVAGIDLVEPDNTDKVANLMIPPQVKVPNLPTYLQEMCQGVYNGGVATYLQLYEDKKLWFVFPPFDFDRFEKTKGKKVVFYAAPSTKYPKLERTYEIKGDLVRVIVTGDRQYRDGADIDQMNDGSGFRVPDARAFMKSPVALDGKTVKPNRARLNHEVNYGNREDGLNYAPVSLDGPTANPFKYRSRVLQRNTGRVDFVWENGDAELLYPGMPCRFNFLNQGKVQRVDGVLAYVRELTAPITRNNISGYRSNLHLVISTKTREDIPDAVAQDLSGGYNV